MNYLQEFNIPDIKYLRQIIISAKYLTPTSTISSEYTANPTWGDIFECCFKAQSSKLERLSSLKRGKRDVRALSSELSKMSLQVGLAVPAKYTLAIFAK